MKVEVKEYLKIGIGRLMNIKVYKYDETKDLESLDDIAPLYEGPCENAPESIKEMTYVKCELGEPTIYYV